MKAGNLWRHCFDISIQWVRERERNKDQRVKNWPSFALWFMDSFPSYPYLSSPRHCFLIVIPAYTQALHFFPPRWIQPRASTASGHPWLQWDSSACQSEADACGGFPHHTNCLIPEVLLGTCAGTALTILWLSVSPGRWNTCIQETLTRPLYWQSPTQRTTKRKCQYRPFCILMMLLPL